MQINPPPADSLRKMAQGAFVWVAVFIAFHVYWAFGGKFGFGDATQTQPKVDSAAKWVFTILVGLMFLVGAVVPPALYQDLGRRIPAWMLAWSCWIGAAILLLRGFSYGEELGVAHPSAYTLICGTAIDLYFTVGGVLFLAAAIAHRRSRHRAAHPSIR